MAEGIGVDASGAVYVSGFTNSLDFPPQRVQFPRRDAFIVKFAPDGKSLVYSAFFPIGGYGIFVASKNRALLPESVDAGVNRRPDGISIMIGGNGAGQFAVDGSGAAYLAGGTSNNHFPVKNAFQPEYGGGWVDGFFLKLAPDGKSLDFSSYYGGSFEDYLTALAVDDEGALYLAGDRTRFFFRLQPNGRPGSRDGEDPWHGVFVFKMTADGQTRVYDKMIEMSGSLNAISDIAVDAAGAVYGTGITSSLDLPVKNPFQRKLAGWLDSFVFKLDPTGADLAYCSYFGGPNLDLSAAIAVDGKGAAYLTGYTMGKVPVKNGFRMGRRGSFDGFLAKLEPDGKSLAWSTYFGGEGWDVPMDLALDASGRAYVVGETSSRYFHVKDAYKSMLTGTYDGFLTVFTPNGRSLELSTLFGGSSSDSISCLALEAGGGICLAGYTNGRDLPLLEPFQAGFGGGYLDGFVVKFKR
jgi:hypothetical protein